MFGIKRKEYNYKQKSKLYFFIAFLFILNDDTNIQVLGLPDCLVYIMAILSKNLISKDTFVS